MIMLNYHSNNVKRNDIFRKIYRAFGYLLRSTIFQVVRYDNNR